MFNPNRDLLNPDHQQLQNNFEGQGSGLSFIDYMVANNPRGVRKAMYKNGFPADLDPDMNDLRVACAVLAQEDQGIIDLMRNHPDFELIKKIVLVDQKRKNKKSKNNIAFFSAKGEYKNATSSELKIQQEKNKFITNLFLLGLAGLFLYLITRP